MFDPRKQQPINQIPILDPITTSDVQNTTWVSPILSTKTSQNWPNSSDNGGIQFRVQDDDVDDDDGGGGGGGSDKSGVSSPPLCQNSPTRHPFYPRQVSANYRSLSPNARTLAIARGQWELMEMVKNMPESCYELSLRDLVEKPKVLESQEESLLINKEDNYSSTSTNQVVHQRVDSSVNKIDLKKAKVVKSGSSGNKGVFLKTLFPIPPKNPNTTKVSPKPEGSDKSSRSVDKDWWKKRFSGSRESDSSSRTTTSSSSNTERSGSSGSTDSSSTRSRTNINRERKGFLTRCWSRLCFSKSKTAE